MWQRHSGQLRVYYHNIVYYIAMHYSMTLCQTPFEISTLKGGVDVLSTCVGVTSSLTAAEVAMLTSAWAELLTQASINDLTVGYNCIAMWFCYIFTFCETMNKENYKSY